MEETRSLASTRDAQPYVQPGRLVVWASMVCVDALAPFTERDWKAVRARDLDWSVWETMVHVNDDLYFYAG